MMSLLGSGDREDTYKLLNESLRVISNSTLAWYPFRKDSKILYIDNENNINEKFDYIVYIPNKEVPILDFDKFIIEIKRRLTDSGKLLFVIPNKLGIKYLCGAPNIFNGVPFDGITEKLNFPTFTRNEVMSYFYKVGFDNIKLYYPFPDYDFPQFIYTDEYKPGEELKERLRVSITNNSSRVLEEIELIKLFNENTDDLLNFSNSFIVECGNSTPSDILYTTLSIDRKKEVASMTVVRKDSFVEKLPIYEEGIEGLRKLKNNTDELFKKGVPVLPIELKEDRVVMEKISSITLSQYIRNLIKDRKKDEIISLIDRLYEYILASSSYVDESKNALKIYNPSINWGPILKKAYIDMIPVNCFFINNELLFYDQEFTKNNCPAKYVLYRAINDIYYFSPEMEELIPLSILKRKYDLEDVWEYMINVDTLFYQEIINKELSKFFSICIKNEKMSIVKNRRFLRMSNEKQYALFNPLLNLNNEKIILFGSGKYCDYFLEKYSEYRPIFIIDNDKNKWGTFKNGIEIKSSMEINNLTYGSYRIIITVANYQPIIEQLQNMGITDEYYRVYERNVDELLPFYMPDTVTDGKYNIGYVTGVFDLFHIGHLNLLSKSKSRCHYLIVGVVDDDLAETTKHKRPYIPFDERVEIIKQCKYVDRVIRLTKDNTNVLEVWKELRYGCLFAGSDHENEPTWINLQNQLRSLGSNLEFFPYTKGTSSTMLQNIIKNEVEKGEK